MCQAVSVVSGLYAGVSPATHSPQPVTPSTFASTSRMRRTSVRATLIWKKLLAEYQAPPLDPAVREAVADHVARRRRELGHPG